MPMAMTREEQDALDRRMAGIMDPMLRPEGTAGGPVRSYSLDDIRRFLGFGNRPAMSPAEVADAAQMYERLPNPALPPTPPGGYDAPSPSIPYMPSTDPRGAAAPIPPPPRPAAPARPRAPRGAPGAMPANVEAMPMAGVVPPATPGAMTVSVEPMLPPVPPVPLTNPSRPDPQMLARMLMRAGRPPIGNEAEPLPPGSEMQLGPAPLGGMPVEAQADQTMRSVSRVNPQSFGQRFRGVMAR
jgi:hypothetical protein